jgi:uncharacterized RDD family membrane protein YckC
MEYTTCLLRRWVALWLDIVVIFLFLFGAYNLLGKGNFQRLFPLWIVLTIIYYPLLEGFYASSFGKFIVGIEVVDMQGNPPGFIKSILRTIPRIIETNPLFFGGVPAGIVYLISKHNQRFGDILAGTIVVRKSDIEQIKAESLKSEKVGNRHCNQEHS